MKFLIDAQLPIALARMIRAGGFQAVHVFDLGLAGGDDSEIWRRACIEREIIVTKDEDFAVRRMLVVEGPQIVWLRIGNCSNRALLIWLGSTWPGVERQLLAGDALVEVI